MGDTNERAARFKASRRAKGLVQCNVWVPAKVAADFKRAAELACENHALTIGRMVDGKTGRMRGMK